MNAETMITGGLISVQAMTARIACRWITAVQLEAVSESIDQAARMPATPQWERKAAAHVEIFSLRGLHHAGRLAGPVSQDLLDLRAS